MLNGSHPLVHTRSSGCWWNRIVQIHDRSRSRHRCVLQQPETTSHHQNKLREMKNRMISRTTYAWPRRGICCCCCCHRIAGKSRSIAPRWPRLTARLQRSAGGRLLSFRIWSTHLLWGRPGQQCHWLLGGRPRDRLTWQLSALWAIE